MRRLKSISFIASHLGIFLALCVFAFQAFAVTHVGMSWDEPSSFFIGQANKLFWMTGNRSYVTDLKNKTLFASEPIPYIYGEDIYPPFPFVFSSFVSHIVSDSYHLMNVFDGYHLGEVILGSLGVWALYGLAMEAGLSVPAGVAVVIAYALYPLIFGPMRNDAKDIPLISMLLVSSYVFMKWFSAWQRKDYSRVWPLGLLFAVVFGLAECTKPTAAIFVPIVMVWLFVASLRNAQFRRSMKPLSSFFGMSVIMGLTAVIVFIIAWPWLWDDPAGKLTQVWAFFRTVGYNMMTPYFGHIYNAGVSLPRSYAYVILLIQTPIEITILAAIGYIWVWVRYIRKGEVIPMLFVVWFTLGIGRFAIPGVIIYAGVRHFIDAMPAFFILVGFGVMWCAQNGVTLTKRFLPKVPFLHESKNIALLAALIIFLHQAIISIIFFPYELSYFNVLVGGTANVAKHLWFDVGQGSSVREGMDFIIRDAKGSEKLIYPCQMGHLMIGYLPPNIKLTRGPELGNYTMVPNSPSWFDGALKFGNEFHEKAYVVRRAGADLFYVYKYTRSVGWRCGWETDTNYDY